MFFIGDGTEVLACEAYRANAESELARLQSTTDDNLSIYECDPNEISVNDACDPDAENYCWSYPAERAVAEKSYDLLTMPEAIAKVGVLQ
jgi:hypothetical protein